MNQILWVSLLLIACSTAFSQSPDAGLESLGWLAGCWEGNYAGGRFVTEQWMKPLGGSMMGIGRTVKNGKTIEYEFVRIVLEDDGSVVYIAKPSGQSEASFKLVKLDGKRVVFENLQHDFPQRVIYYMPGPDSLVGRIEGVMNGKEKGIDFPYRRVKCE
ncbi:MAG: DUF6265 family protein [bacterium]